MKLNKYLLRHASNGKNVKVNLSAPMVTVGPYTIQEGWMHGSDIPGQPGDIWDVVNQVCSIRGVNVDVEHSGTRSGHGHGREILRLVNDDGTLIYEVSHVDYCEGPGSSCSYSHGPWHKYGTFRGNAAPDEDLMAALEAKRVLSEKFSF